MPRHSCTRNSSTCKQQKSVTTPPRLFTKTPRLKLNNPEHTIRADPAADLFGFSRSRRRRRLWSSAMACCSDWWFFSVLQSSIVVTRCWYERQLQQQQETETKWKNKHLLVAQLLLNDVCYDRLHLQGRSALLRASHPMNDVSSSGRGWGGVSRSSSGLAWPGLPWW